MKMSLFFHFLSLIKINVERWNSIVNVIAKKAEMRKAEGRVQFWAALGPFIIILTLLVGLLKVEPLTLYLSLATLIGVPLCWRWGVRGLVGSLLCLGLLFAMFYSSIPHDERLWQIGVAVSVSLGLIVTTLSFEEVSASLQQLEEGSKIRLEKLLLLESRLGSTEMQWHADREEFAARLRQITEESIKSKRQADVYEKLVGSLRAEFTALNEHKERLLSESKAKAQEAAQLKEEVALSRKGLESLRGIYEAEKGRVEGFYNEKTSTLQAQESELKQLQEKHAQLQVQLTEASQRSEGLAALQKTYQTLQLEKKETIKQLEASNCLVQEQEAKLATAFQKLADQKVATQEAAKQEAAKQEAAKQEVVVQEVATPPIAAVSPTQTPSKELNELRHVGELYKQLRGQFEEKCQVLHATRMELFHKEGEILVIRKEAAEHTLEPSIADIALQGQLLALELEKDSLEKEVKTLQELVSNCLGRLYTPLS